VSSESEKLPWIDFLTSRFARVSEAQLAGDGGFGGLVARTGQVARARWLLLILIAMYGAFAGSSFMFSSYGFFLSSDQFVILVASVTAVVCYNAFYHFGFQAIAHYRYASHFQIVLDQFFTAMLIHYSGGAASWFWPMFLVITIEAAFLLERKREVWPLVATGFFFYCVVLYLENQLVLPYVSMPFVDERLYDDSLYLLLMALWVGILNVATAFVANFFVSIIRREAALVRQSEERLLGFLDSAHDLIHCNDADGTFLYANQAFLSTLGMTQESLPDSTLTAVIHQDYRAFTGNEIAKVLEGGGSANIESLFTARNGDEISVEGSVTRAAKAGRGVALWGIWRDITERKQSQEKLYNLAHHDNLTGLPNRILFIDRLRHAMALAQRQRKLVALLFVDLDRFKVINDTLGHPVGDKLLQAVARRLQTTVREVDSVARFGGDEYTIVLVNLAQAEDAQMVAGKVLASLAKPYQIDQHELYVTASTGISLYPQDSEEVDSLITKADIAMYRAKGLGGNRHITYEPSMDEHAHKRLVLENSLRKALEKEEFRLYYQPKVDIVTGSVTAMEALLRWQHPEFGLVAPGDFIPLAEETGLILPIGEWVLEKACLQNLTWQGQGLPKMRVAVNLSGHQLQQKNFLDIVKRVLVKTGLPAQYLELEITETVIMQNPEFVIEILKELQQLGAHISVDDFGTGYSSLAHLKRFSINTLKIDKSFVRDVTSNSTDAAIATAIIAMGNSLKLKVIAEGVETEGQFSFLQRSMCDEVQGYLVSRPMPADKVFEFIRGRSWEKIGRGGERSE
jgi:diguanylate cyclase (GGDEF)-like protein/PAS domain S-box-containing protein